MADVFKGPSTTTIPKSDPRIVRVGLDKSDLGARKSHLPKNIKNDNSIKHVS
jgi:hypothetical protein